jgi:uncharacterized protein (TIGR02145 family)
MKKILTIIFFLMSITVFTQTVYWGSSITFKAPTIIVPNVQYKIHPDSLPIIVYYGQVYKVVQIGNQYWLDRNLNVGTKIISPTSQTDNGVVEKYCYSNNDLYCNEYGGLYQWGEMVQYLNGVTNTTHWTTQPTNVKGICPSGWHIPTYSEATSLMNYLGGTTVAGGKMKKTGTTHWYSPNTGASNTSKFSAAGSGWYLNGSFSTLKAYGLYWTVSKGNLAKDAWYFGAAYNYPNNMTGQTYKISAIGVRCVKD